MLTKRRGIGNVIAAAVMVFLIIFTVSQLYVYNINQLDNYNQVAQNVFNANSLKVNERISIANAQMDVSGATTKITLSITNTGGVTSHVVAVWIDDATSSATLHLRCSLSNACTGWVQDYYVGPGLTVTITGLDTGLSSTLSHELVVKVLTALGNSVSTTLLPPSLAGTTAQTLAATSMTVVPPNPITSNSVTFVLTVNNNNQLGVAFTNLAPDLCLIQGSFAPISSSLESGTATAASPTTLTDASKVWGVSPTNAWAGYVVSIVSGTGVGQSRIIVSNTATQLTIVTSNPWTNTPDATSQYAIANNCHSGPASGLSGPILLAGTASGGTSGATPTLSDGSQTWSVNQWVNDAVVITSGPGAGESGTISSNTATTLTISPTGGSWTTAPTASSKYSIRGNLCNTASGGATTVPVACSYVPASYQARGVAVSSGATSLPITFSPAQPTNTYTVDVIASWTTTVSITSKTTTGFTLNFGTAAPNGASISWAFGVSPNPSSLSFLPSGSSAVFQWTYLVNTVVPDSPVTVSASYVNMSTSYGLFASQIPSQTLTVRQVGGTSSQSGQGLSSNLGSITIDLTSFQYAKIVSGAVCWKIGFQPKGSDTTVFRIRMTNIGSTTITLYQDSEFVTLKASTGGGGQLQPQEWFLALNAQPSGGVIAPVPLPVGNGVTIAPGQTIAVYFGSASQNSGSAVSLPSSGSRLFTFIILLGTQTGSVTNFGQSIPFVGLSTTSSDPAGCGSY